MSARNIHSLSLALSPLRSHTAGSPPASSPPPPTSAPHTCQIPHPKSPPSATLAAADKSAQDSLGPSASTKLRHGLITPATPTFPASPRTDDREDSTNAADDMVPTDLPSPSISSPSSSVDDVDWFLQERYAPLSHLPTPPISAACSPDTVPEEEPSELLDPEYSGAAKYLVSMIPYNASRSPPSVQLLHGILQRADLFPETLALACCVLDCLSSQFIRNWRRECLEADGYPERSELLAVGALSLAMKFMEDRSYTAHHWARRIAGDVWMMRSLVTTERLILADLDYNIMGICTEENIEWNLAELRRAGLKAKPVEEDAYSLSGGAKYPLLDGDHFPVLSEL